jgi:hypothetical protein
MCANRTNMCMHSRGRAKRSLKRTPGLGAYEGQCGDEHSGNAEGGGREGGTRRHTPHLTVVVLRGKLLQERVGLGFVVGVQLKYLAYTLPVPQGLCVHKAGQGLPYARLLGEADLELTTVAHACAQSQNGPVPHPPRTPAATASGVHVHPTHLVLKGQQPRHNLIEPGSNEAIEGLPVLQSRIPHHKIAAGCTLSVQPGTQRADSRERGQRNQPPTINMPFTSSSMCPNSSSAPSSTTSATPAALAVALAFCAAIADVTSLSATTCSCARAKEGGATCTQRNTAPTSAPEKRGGGGGNGWGEADGTSTPWPGRTPEQLGAPQAHVGCWRRTPATAEAGMWGEGG